jgi:hypothetical protein
MFNWFKKSQQAPTIQQRNGLFSTDAEIREPSRFDRAKSLAKSIQRNAKQDVDNTVGMDEWDEAFENKITSTDVVPHTQFNWYASQGFIGWQTCAIMAQNWLINKACTMPARDAIRHGYELSINGGDDVDPAIIEFIKKRDKKFALKKHCIELVRMGRIFGIRIAMFMVKSEDPRYYEKPFNIDGVTAGSYIGITQIDPYWVSPELDHKSASDPSSKHFYEPTWWRINGKRVHRSHLVIFRNGEVPDILKPSYLYGGIPVPQLIAERVYAAEKTANEAPQLAMSKRTTVIKLDVEKALANEAQFKSQMNWWAATRDSYGAKIVGMDDELQQFDTALSDFDSLIMTQYQLVASAAGVPATKLLGTSPKGFDSAGQQEQDSYHEELETIQENDMATLIERHHELLMRSEIIPKFGRVFEIVITWNSVDSPSAKEAAEINHIKAQTGNALVQSGAIDGHDERERLIKDKDSGYNGMVMEELPLPDIQEEEEFNEFNNEKQGI